ncbi:NACHT, LRR and PYD domains-containing protein 10 [Canis lupus familiaris]|uniref:NLR family pyrin domain containing 10 n=1 Tax=Canis lupus familiaris TaxID=9615 RepID=A0A8I3NDJ0_CANLF|nr:NACHT, LRR and PYD domains-containing protein 10 [Canis lupus familiaris]XP_038286344.1 NACHT, LRR and PYD domains-containing protein 10 [Canis lupus familiaris]XP_038286345.1 NACHT, LRR and PYD domains-containing protein 10 [Canis lupus familiaris]XP_038286346.1 NACHT, LRR and PYD domains-containing protein 10 [Canis lupus familiaris]XP_038286347.1 NACHT, LRR and PYD domains-containing protein 10 [Canis lupus familiaris]
MALTRNPREALLWALSDLEEKNFKLFKFHLRDRSLLEGRLQLARGELEGLSPVDLASRLISLYGALEAVKVVVRVLRVMNLLEPVDQLSHICLNDYREIYREHVRCCLEERQEESICGSHSQLLLVATSSPGSPESSACPVLEQELDSVLVETLFDPGEKSYQAPPTVVLQGSAGTGKTTLARKMVLDWATGTLYPGRFDYVFYVSCREVVLLQEGVLDQLLFWCCGDNQAPVREMLREAERLLFILDGFDELQRPFVRGLKSLRLSPMEKVLHCLIRREVLSTCSLLITTRPLALQNLNPLLKQSHHIHILGFSEDERRRYFSSYFMDEEQARNAFDIVRGNDVLYKSCQIPGICWVICSWIKEQMEKGREISETPSNGTDIFMAYVSTFLPPSDNEGCSKLTRHRVLKGLCSLAAEGIQHQRFMFEEADLRKHNLDGTRLAAFLSSMDYQEGLDIKKFYIFRHISFQEFFHAMSYLVKEDQSQLEKESRKEVKRILDEERQAENEEMTLSMHFLLDILKKETSSNFELKFSLKISPLVKQDLKHFKEQMKSIKHKGAWDLEFSLNQSKIRNLVKGVQISDVSLKMQRSNKKQPHDRNSFSVKTSLINRWKEKEKCPFVDEDNIEKTQMEASNGKGRKMEKQEMLSVGAVGREVEEWDSRAEGSGRLESQGQEDGGRQSLKKMER